MEKAFPSLTLCLSSCCLLATVCASFAPPCLSTAGPLILDSLYRVVQSVQHSMGRGNRPGQWSSAKIGRVEYVPDALCECRT